MGQTMNLAEFAKGRMPEFRPYKRYCSESDCLEIFVGGDDAYAERVDDLLTVYWSESDNDALMGCEIKGVREIVAEAGAIGVAIAKNGRLKLAGLFMAYQGLHPDKIPVRTYHKLVRFAMKNNEELELAC